MTILRFSLKRIFQSPANIIVGFILPTGLLLLTGMWDEGGRGFYFIAMILMIAAFPYTNIMLVDRKEKTVQRIMSTPTTTFQYLSQNLAACMVPLLLQIILVCVLGGIRYEWSLEFTLFLGLAYVLFAATGIAFAFAWNCLFKNESMSLSVLITVLLFSAVFGIFMSPSVFPDAIRIAAMIFPTYWVSTGVEELLYHGGFSIEFLMPMGVLALFTAIFLLYGSKRGAY